MNVTPTEQTPLRVRIWMRTNTGNMIFLLQSYGAYDPYPANDGDIFIVWSEQDVVEMKEFFDGLVADDHDIDPNA